MSEITDEERQEYIGIAKALLLKHREDPENNPIPACRVQCEDCVGVLPCSTCEELTDRYMALLCNTYPKLRRGNWVGIGASNKIA